MVVEAPLASKPPCREVPAEQRTKARHDPKHKSTAQPEAVADLAKVSKANKPKTTIAKPGQSYAQVGTKKSTEAEFHCLYVEAAEQRLRDAQAKAKADKEAKEKEKAAKEAALLEKQKKDLEQANLTADAKKKLAEAKEN